ncbi:MAG: hypothetical protein RIF32_11295 [Leptospirales bacterium]|jgi:hypothetical protein
MIERKVALRGVSADSVFSATSGNIFRAMTSSSSNSRGFRFFLNSAKKILESPGISALNSAGSGKIQTEVIHMLYNVSKLEAEKLAAVQQLEKDLGKTFLAFTPYDLKPADLSDAELARIKILEKQLSVSLVAVEA